MIVIGRRLAKSEGNLSEEGSVEQVFQKPSITLANLCLLFSYLKNNCWESILEVAVRSRQRLIEMLSGIAVISPLLGLYSARCCPLYGTLEKVLWAGLGPLHSFRYSCERGLGGRPRAHGFNQVAPGMHH